MERVEKSNKRKRRRGDVYMEARSEKIEGVQLCIFLKKKKKYPISYLVKILPHHYRD